MFNINYRDSGYSTECLKQKIHWSVLTKEWTISFLSITFLICKFIYVGW